MTDEGRYSDIIDEVKKRMSADDSESKAYSQTISTRVDKFTYEALTRLANEMGVSQSQAVRYIVGAFTTPEQAEMIFEHNAEQIMSNPDNLYNEEFTKNDYVELFLWARDSKGLFDLRKDLQEKLKETEARIDRMHKALFEFKKLIQDNPILLGKGGDETTEKP